MISIILLEIENPGNLGAIARVMANFDCSDLVLVNPQCKPLDEAARCRAKHAQKILENAMVTDAEVLKTFDCLIGTTAKLGSDYNVPRSPTLPDELPAMIAGKKTKIGLLIGREGIGLTTEELKKCDFVVTIPTSSKYPTLNVSHAVAVLLYELFKERGKLTLQRKFIPAGQKEKEHLLKKVDALLEKLSFVGDEKRETQRIVWKKLVGKAFLTRREAFALFGLFKKVDDVLKKKR